MPLSDPTHFFGGNWVDDVLGGLQKPGDLNRAGAIAPFLQQFNDKIPAKTSEDLKSILKGEKTFSFTDLKNEVEDAYDIDLTFGDRDFTKQTMGEMAKNLTFDIIGDVLTSPETYLPFGVAVEAPAKLFSKALSAMKAFDLAYDSADSIAKVAKGMQAFKVPGQSTVSGAVFRGSGKALEKLSVDLKNPIAEKLLTQFVHRGFTGAAFGLAAVNADDDAETIAKKIGIAAALGSGGVTALKAASRVAADGANGLVDLVMSGTSKDAIEKLSKVGTPGDISFVDAFKVNQGFHRKSNALMRSFVKGKKRSEAGLSSVKSKELNGLSELDVYDNVIEEAYNSTVNFRETFHGSYEGMLDAGIINKNDALGLQAVTEEANTLGANVAKARINKIESINPLVGSKIRDAVAKHKKANQELILQYNKYKMSDLSPADRRQYDPLRGFDFSLPQFKFAAKDLDEIDVSKATIEELDEIVTGFRKKSKVLKEGEDAAEQISRADRIDLGAYRFAHAFADEAEIKAKLLLKDFSEKNLGEGATVMDLGRKALGLHDSYMQLIKSTQLVLNSSWLISQFVDNIGKAYVEHGLGEAAKVGSVLGASSIRALGKPGVKPKVAAASLGAMFGALTSGEDADGTDTLINAVIGAGATVGGTKVLDTLLNRVNGLEELTRKTDLIPKLMKMTDNEADVFARIDFDDPLLNVQRDLDVISTDKFTEARQLAKDTPELLMFRGGPLAAAKALKRFETAGIFESLGYTAETGANLLWNSGPARYASAIETSIKSTVFEDVLKAELKDPDLFKQLKTDPDLASDALQRYQTLSGKTDEFLRSGVVSPEDAKLLQIGSSMQSAASITNKAFFNYNDIELYERAIMRRIMPYWVFQSQNFRWWMDSLFDPKKMARAAKLAATPAGQGRRPTDIEEAGLPQFRQNPGRIMAVRPVKGQAGDRLVLNMPQLSSTDFTNLLRSVGSTGVPFSLLGVPSSYVGSSDWSQRTSPLLRGLIETMTGRHSLTDKSILPSGRDTGGKVRVYRDGEIPHLVMGSSIIEDQNGKLWAVTDNAAGLDMFRRNFVPPTPIIDGMIGIGRHARKKNPDTGERTKVGTRNLNLALLNAFTPFKVQSVEGKDIRKRGRKELRNRKRTQKGDTNIRRDRIIKSLERARDKARRR